MYIDNTQLTSFLTCPWLWWERYVKGMTPDRPNRQRDDALALGGLVHAGLEVLGNTGEAQIPEGAMQEWTPSLECFRAAQKLLAGFSRAFPEPPWKVQKCEEPLTFPLMLDFDGPDIQGLAKIDQYYYVPTETVLESGTSEYPLVLSPGWWINEYKTKAATRLTRGAWMAQWQMNLQASFQCLALRKKIGEWPRGVLLTTLEKPAETPPKRKCKQCKGLYEYAAYLLVSEGGHACPMCGHCQVLSALAPRTEKEPTYFRFSVERTPERLERDLQIITNVARAMDTMADDGPLSTAWPDFLSCVNSVTGWQCEFFEPHVAMRWAEDCAGFVRADTLKYMERKEKVDVV